MTATNTADKSTMTNTKNRTNVNRWFERLTGSPAAIVGASILIALTLIAIFAPWIAPYDPDAVQLVERLKAPSSAHWFGTDQLGRDVMSRVIYGGRYSLMVGLVATVVSMCIGSILGLIAGFYGGIVDAIIMRIIDVILAFPGILLAIGVVAVRGPGLVNTVIAISITGIPIYARLVRSTALTIREQEYVVASRSVGASDSRLIFRHILPNCISLLIIQASLTVGTKILDAAALGFLGLGVQPPASEWGSMLADGYKFLLNAPWAIAGPGIAIALAVIGANLLGDGLRDAFDTRQ